MKNSPIFIGGLDNSGKTLLRLSLSSHPNIAMTRRTYMWTRVYNRYGDLRQRENFEACLSGMLGRKDVRALRPDPERIRREFWQGEPTYGRLFAILHEHFAEQLAKPRWGEQEGSLEQYVDEIFAAYPFARVIHMVRDPRNRYEEMLLTTPPKLRLGRVGVNTTDWLRSVRLARRNEQKYPATYRVFRYEDLLSHPEETLRRVCEFIGEDFVPAMITLDGAIRFGSRGDAAAAAEEWKTDGVEFHPATAQAVSRREAVFMQAIAHHEMAVWGYTSHRIRLSAAEALLYYGIDWPFSIMRMAAWEFSTNRLS